jgi:hypothetical protein
MVGCIAVPRKRIFKRGHAYSPAVSLLVLHRREDFRANVAKAEWQKNKTK